MNRSPSPLVRMPPSPRAASETSVPAAFSGSMMPEGWNWTSSASRSRAPASTARRKESPVFSSRRDEVRPDAVVAAGGEDDGIGVDPVAGAVDDVEAVGAEDAAASDEQLRDVDAVEDRDVQC